MRYTRQEYLDRVAELNGHKDWEELLKAVGPCRAYARCNSGILDMFTEEKNTEIKMNYYAEILCEKIEREYNPESEDYKDILKNIVQNFIKDIYENR